MPEGQEVVNTEAVEEAATAEATTVETQSSEEQHEEAAPKLKTVLGDDGTVTQVEDDGSEDAEDDTAPKKGAEARKEQLGGEISQQSEEIRQLVAEKNRIVQEREQAERELAELRQTSYQQALQQQLPTVEQLMQQENPDTKDFYTEFEAKAMVQNATLQQQIAQMQQQREVDAQNAQIAASVNGLASDADRALRDFPVFDSQSPEYDPELSATVDAIVDEMLIRDNTGNPVGAKMSVYNIYKSYFDAAKPAVEARKAGGKAQVTADFRGSGQRVQRDVSKMSLADHEMYLRQKGYKI